MNTLPFLEVLVGIFFGLIVVMIVLLLLQVRSNRQIGQLTFPAYEYVMKRTEHEAGEIIKKAQAEARAITTAAETEARAQAAHRLVEITEAQAIYAGELKQYYGKATDTLTETYKAGRTTIEAVSGEIVGVVRAQESSLRTATDEAVASWGKITTQLTTVAEAQATLITTDLQALSKKLTDSVVDAQAAHAQAIADQVAASMRQVESDLASYQKGRQAILDTHIEQLVEAVTAEVLHHSLSSADHASLARVALTEARAKRII